MTTPEPWENLVAAEHAYIVRRMELFAGDLEQQLRLALASPRGRGAALRVLRDAAPELITALSDELVVSATTTHSQVGLAREILGRLDPAELEAILTEPVAALLDRTDASWEDYRRFTELLAAVAQTALLARLVERAAQSDDPDIAEVAEDFGVG